MSYPFNFGAMAGPVDSNPPRHSLDPALLAETLEPRPIERPAPCPPVRVPRSARGTYSHADLCVAADLLATLRRRAEVRPPPARSAYDADHAMDVAVDRLLDLL